MNFSHESHVDFGKILKDETFNILKGDFFARSLRHQSANFVCDIESIRR